MFTINKGSTNDNPSFSSFKENAFITNEDDEDEVDEDEVDEDGITHSQI